MRRRLIWTAIWGYLAVNFLMFLRFFFPRALFEPSTVHTIGYPSDFSLGVNEKYKQADRIWVVKEPDRLFVIFARCVHLGCTPDWKPNENKFKCPCHGSGYTPEGINFEGPAPRPMDRAHVDSNAEIIELSAFFSLTAGGNRMAKSWSIEPHAEVSAIPAGAMSIHAREAIERQNQVEAD